MKCIKCGKGLETGSTMIPQMPKACEKNRNWVHTDCATEEEKENHKKAASMVCPKWLGKNIVYYVPKPCNCKDLLEEQCEHNWEVTEEIPNEDLSATVVEVCTKCGKTSEMNVF